MICEAAVDFFCRQPVIFSILKDAVGVNLKSCGEKVVLGVQIPDWIHGSVQSRSSKGSLEGTVSLRHIHWRPNLEFRPI